MANFISIDLELEQPNTNKQTADSFIDYEKIISLGICVGDETGKVLHSENVYLHYPHPISAFIKQLTGITEADVVNGVSPKQAWARLEELREIHDASRVLLEWGAGDYSALVREAEIDLDKSVFGRSGMNVKHLYRTWCVAHQMSPSGGLKTSMNKFRENSTDPENKFFRFEDRAHNSEVDAINTFKFYIRLMKTMI